MKRFFSITLLSSLLTLFVFSDMAMGQIFRNRLSSNRSGAMVQPKDVFTKDGIKLGIDTPLHILKETAEQEPEYNERTGNEDWTIPNTASFYLGQCYLLGYNSCPKDEEKAAEYFDRLFDMLGIGHANFQRWTGFGIPSAGRNQRIILPPPTDESFNDLMSKYIARIRQEAEKGDAKSQIKLSKYYTLGMGVKSNPQESAKWMRRAAEQGNTEAQEILAMFYAEGHGVRVNRAAFEKWSGEFWKY